jgi:hypothetical protein
MLKRRKRKIKTALFLSPHQIKSLKQIAQKQDVSMARLVREGADLVIKKYTKKKHVDKV